MKAERLALEIATAGGVGYAPFAPATFGSAVGVAVYLAFPGSWTLFAALTAAGFWSARLAVRHFKTHDPKPVVIDEVAAQYLALLLQAPGGPLGVAAGFLLFRVLDVLKPFGIRRLEKPGGGVGVMLDDLAAALLGGLVLRVLARRLGWPL